MTTATAQANANIAFIKYWGNRRNTLGPFMNSSALANLHTLNIRTKLRLQSLLAAPTV